MLRNINHDIDFINPHIDFLNVPIYKLSVRRQAPSHCPVCAEPLRIARLECDACHTAIEGDFDNGRLGRLSRDQLSFVEVFLECRGKIKDVEERLGLSYPTVVARLEQVVEALGSPNRAQSGDRQTTVSTVDALLGAVARKEISPAEAAKRLRRRKS